MDAATNPYNPGAGVKPPYLAARDEDLEALRVAIERMQSGRGARGIVLSGLRGVGKTVLLREYLVIAQEAGWIAEDVIECNEDDDVGELLARSAYRALRRLRRSARAIDAINRALAAVKSFQLTFDAAGTWSFNLQHTPEEGLADSGHRGDDLTELMAELGEAARASGTGVVLLLDEMQSLSRDDLALLASVFHQLGQIEVPVLLTAAGLPQLSSDLSRARPYAERLFAYRHVASVTTSAARSALVVPAQRLDVGYDDDALEHILAEADGYPYFLQQWGSASWNEAEGHVITLEDVTAAEEIVTDELDRQLFRDRYNKATQAERIYMAALADLGDGPHTSRAVADRMSRPITGLSPARDGLLKKGLIYTPRDNDLDFTVPQFARYIRRVHPFDPQERPAHRRR